MRATDGAHFTYGCGVVKFYAVKKFCEVLCFEKTCSSDHHFFFDVIFFRKVETEKKSEKF